MASVASVKLPPIVSRTALAHALHDGIRLYVGRGRRYSVKQVSNATLVPDRVIEAVMAPVEGEDFRLPASEYIFSLIRFLGADFANELMPALCHIGTFDIPDQEMPPPGEVIAESAEDHASIARAGADGEFCDRDQAKLRLVGQDHIERGLQLVALGGKPARKAVAA